jgi:MFS family permease
VSRRAGSLVIAFALLDLTVIGVQLPTLRADLGSSASGGQWIMTASLLAIAVVLPLARAARVDRRALLVAGAVAMAAGAAVCATAGSTSALVAGRAIEGAGLGALLAPIAMTGAALPLAALALGPIVGGGLAEKNWWHLYFGASAFAAVVLAAVAWRDAPVRAPQHPLDRATAALPAVLVVLTILLVQGEPWGLSRALVVPIGVAAVVALAWGALPWVRGVAAAAGGAVAAVFFLMPQYLELSHLIHPLRSGVWLAAFTIPGVAAGVVGRHLRGASPPALLVAAGALTAAVGALALGWIDADSSEALFGAGLVLTGAGFGFAAGGSEDGEPLTSAAIGATLTLAVAGATFQYTQADLRANAESFQHSLSRGVGEGLLLLVLVSGAMAVGQRRARPAPSAARPAAES